MNEVFCVMECVGSSDDIMRTLVAIYSKVEPAMEFMEQVMAEDDKVILRLERWDVDGCTSNIYFVPGRNDDVLDNQDSDTE